VVLELLIVPVKRSDLGCFSAIHEQSVAKISHLTTVLDACGIVAALVNLGRARSDSLWDLILLRRDVFRVKRIRGANHPVFNAHFALVAVLDVGFFEIIE